MSITSTKPHSEKVTFAEKTNKAYSDFCLELVTLRKPDELSKRKWIHDEAFYPIRLK